MPKVTVTDTQGLVQSTGAGVTIESSTTFTGPVALGLQLVTAAGTNSSTAGLISALGGTIAAVSAADGTKGVRLPTPTAGRHFVIINKAGSALKVYPETGGALNNNGSVDGNVTIASAGQLICYADGTYWWVSEPAVAS